MLRSRWMLRLMWTSAHPPAGRLLFPTTPSAQPGAGAPRRALTNAHVPAAAKSSSSACSLHHVSAASSFRGAARLLSAAPHCARQVASAAAFPAGASGNPAAQQQQQQQQYSPLQRCLLRHGVEGVTYWEGPRYNEYSEEWGSTQLEPKLVALAAEGVAADHLAKLLRQPGPIPADADAFLGNLAVLSTLLAPAIPPAQLAESPLWTPGTSAAALLVARSPACLAAYLSRPLGALAAARSWFQREMGIDRAQLARMIFVRPCVLNAAVGPDIHALLVALDDLAGASGWGRQLMERDPVVVTASSANARANIEALLGAGYTREQVCAALEAHANALVLRLGGPAARQKFEWIRTASGWSLEAFLAEPKYLAGDLRRMAARLAFLRQKALPVPPSPNRLLTLSTDGAFSEWLGEQLGAPMAQEQWEEWVRQWQETAEGQRWGSPPGS